jgi:hypothetical protein
MSKVIFYILIFQLAVNFCFGSEKDSINSSNSILYEKVYLHVDRELYSPGDNIWFKSYLVSGINNKLIPGYKNIYIQLISESGKVVDNRLLLSNNGIAVGDFKLSTTLKDGSYTIRAHTKYQKNFGEESFFHKKIMIAASKNSLEINQDIAKTKPVKIDVSFLPESGNLIENAINRVAFKAVDETGKGVEIKGKIVDETGNDVVSFRTIYNGMGKFILMPQEGRRYFAIIEKYPEFNFQFEPAKPDGVCMNYKADGNYLLFTLTRNLKTIGTQSFILRASHKGIELFNSKIMMSEFQHAQKLFKGLFPLGISKVTLFDSQNRVVAERVVFVRNNNEKTIGINFNNREYKTREKVEIDIESLLPDNDTITSTLSVAVVHEDYFSSTGNSQTIESYLLLDSELKGSIESPASCFIDGQNISGDEKLDLIMMVNGWRSYYWNDLENYRGKELPNWADIGLSLNGNVIKMWGKKPVVGGKVVLGPFSNGFLFEESATDNNGDFSFNNLYLKDSALIMINAETKNGIKRTDIKLNPQFNLDPFISTDFIKNYCPDINIPMKFYRTNYYRQLTESEYENRLGNILLDEIEIAGIRQESDGHFRLYGAADVSLTITDDDQHYISVLDYLDGKVPGVTVFGEEIRIRSASKNPLLVVDGINTDWESIKNIPIGDIDKIEILKSGYSQAAFGSQGGDGVISILTKMGRGDWEYEFKRIIHGRITPRVRGFQQARQFYSPKYTIENINNPKPDYRPTLLWNPKVKVENGEATIEFYTSDNLAKYRVIVEGISKNGKICLATSLLTVSIPRK